MWVKALDILLDRLKIAGVDFSKVASLSGTAQVSYMLVMLCVIRVMSKLHKKIRIEIWESVGQGRTLVGTMGKGVQRTERVREPM
jgi:hypothetical protein